MILNLILIHALSSNVPLYPYSINAPFRNDGVRLELHQPLPYDLFFEIDPYVWKSDEHSTVGAGGADVRIGWDGKYFALVLHHNSEHPLDHKTDDNFNYNAVELKWKIK